jgi:hypothetical protein
MVYQHVVKAYPSSQTGYVAKLQAELAQLQSGMNHLKESHEASLDHEKALRNELMAQKEHLTSALAALSREVEALKRSRSWRITSPMRALSRWLFHSV